MKEIFSRIESAAFALPKNKMSNDDFIKKYKIESSSDWIKERTGIKSRYFVDNAEELEEITLKCCQKATLDVAKETIDGIIVATSTHCMNFPSLASIMHNKLGLKEEVQIFDINAACNGFLCALAQADLWIKHCGMERVLVVGAEAMSSILDMQERSTSVLFGDGAGAVLLSKSQKSGISNWIHGAKTDHKEALFVDSFIKMNGRTVFENAVKSFEGMIKKILLKSNLSLNEIDYIIPHQANMRIFENIANRLGIAMGKIPFLASETANTSSATIPIAIAQMHSTFLSQKSKIIVAGFGAGFTYSICLLEF